MSDQKENFKDKKTTKTGKGPAANVSFDPEHGYGTSEQKEKIREAGK